MKLYVAMVGLPARGKSTLAKRIRSGLEQQGIRTAIFNNGELRRMLFGLESGSAEFFNPDNTRPEAAGSDHAPEHGARPRMAR